jgi:hypothetical protein
MTLNRDFPKNWYNKFRRFEVQVSSFKNGESSIPLSEVLHFIVSWRSFCYNPVHTNWTRDTYHNSH